VFKICSCVLWTLQLLSACVVLNLIQFNILLISLLFLIWVYLYVYFDIFKVVYFVELPWLTD